MNGYQQRVWGILGKWKGSVKGVGVTSDGLVAHVGVRGVINCNGVPYCRGDGR